MTPDFILDINSWGFIYSTTYQHMFSHYTNTTVSNTECISFNSSKYKLQVLLGWNVVHDTTTHGSFLREIVVEVLHKIENTRMCCAEFDLFSLPWFPFPSIFLWNQDFIYWWLTEIQLYTYMTPVDGQPSRFHSWVIVKSADAWLFSQVLISHCHVTSHVGREDMLKED